MADCIFCNSEKLELVDQNPGIFAIYDKFPVADGHLLIIPKNHRVDFFEMNSEERTQAFELIDQLKVNLQTKDPSITGFNIGINCGADAGQTVFHCHIHLIPRRKGDCLDPTGGVRGVIPDKQSY